MIKKASAENVQGPTRIGRRTLLRGALYLLAGGAGYLTLATSRGDTRFALRLAKRVNRILGLHDNTSLGALGLAPPTGGDRNASLMHSLSGIFHAETASLKHFALLSDGELRRYLRARIAHDYRQGSMRCVHGWWLSETECRVFALAAHLQGTGSWTRLF